MKKISLNTVAGYLLMTVGVLGIGMLVFFYNTVLFSDSWSAFSRFTDMFKLLFTIPSGIAVIYTSFLVLFIPLCALVLWGAWLSGKRRYLTKKSLVVITLIWIFSLVFVSFTTIHYAQKIVERINPFSADPVEFDVSSEIPESVEYVFRTTLKNEVEQEIGTPIEGYEPFMFLQVFPGLAETDFEGVEASIGRYTIEEGRLTHKLDDSRLVHSAAKAVTDRGFNTLLANVSVRLGVNLSAEGTLTEIIEALVRTEQSQNAEESKPSLPPLAPAPDTGDVVACTMDAKICPDGSAVGRQGPRCEFAECPSSPISAPHICTPQEKAQEACTMQYEPVCGLVEVQCIQAPCNPVPQTFGNACSACSEDNVISYTEGMCQER